MMNCQTIPNFTLLEIKKYKNKKYFIINSLFKDLGPVRCLSGFFVFIVKFKILICTDIICIVYLIFANGCLQVGTQLFILYYRQFALFYVIVPPSLFSQIMLGSALRPTIRLKYYFLFGASTIDQAPQLEYQAI